jgi:DNA-binding transcriptional LysR family regulator
MRLLSFAGSSLRETDKQFIAVLQGAIDGHGVALARSVMARDDVAAGRLVRLFPRTESYLWRDGSRLVAVVDALTIRDA